MSYEEASYDEISVNQNSDFHRATENREIRGSVVLYRETSPRLVQRRGHLRQLSISPLQNPQTLEGGKKLNK